MVVKEAANVVRLVQTIALGASTLVANLTHVVRVLYDLCMHNQSLWVRRDILLENALVTLLDGKIALELPQDSRKPNMAGIIQWSLDNTDVVLCANEPGGVES